MNSRILITSFYCRRIHVGSLAVLSLILYSVVPFTGGQSPEPAAVPVAPEHANLGQLYYVVPTESEVKFVSKAPAETFMGRSKQLGGYLVAPKAGGDNRAALVAGELCLPVKSIDTGNPLRNEHLRSDRWMKAGAFPEIVFRLSDVRDVSVQSDASGGAQYAAILNGTMVIAGVSKDLSMPVRLSFHAPGSQSKNQTPSDSLALTVAFDIKLADFGIGVGDPGIQAGKVAEVMNVDVKLVLSTTPQN